VSIGLHDNFAEALAERGGKIVPDVKVQASGKGFRTEISQIRAAKSEAVALHLPPPDVILFLEQARARGLDTKCVGDVNTVDTSVQEALEEVS